MGDEGLESRIGAEIAQLLKDRLKGKELIDIYIDEDEDGQYLGVVFGDGEKEYHLTFQQDGVVDLAEGPQDGDTLEEVIDFELGDLEEPLSVDGEMD